MLEFKSELTKVVWNYYLENNELFKQYINASFPIIHEYIPEIQKMRLGFIADEEGTEFILEIYTSEDDGKLFNELSSILIKLYEPIEEAVDFTFSIAILEPEKNHNDSIDDDDDDGQVEVN